MRFIDEWVTVHESSDGGWDVRLKEGEGSYLLVFVNLPRKEMADGFADRIKGSLDAFALKVVEYCGL